jgi:response regulator RpfG family c-di-GMP phosphodiesterase
MPETPENVTVLYVDDEENNLFLFKASFSGEYNVLTALSGNEGLEKLEKFHKDIIVVISDMRMPNMNGIEFVQKARERYSNIAYFILTGFDYNEQIQNALNNNLIQSFFTKPFDVAEIKKSIDDAVEGFANTH